MNNLQPLLFDQHGTYITVRKPPSFFIKAIKSPYFYVNLIFTIYKSSLIAKDGRYNRKEWHKTSLTVFRYLEKVGIEFEISGVGGFSQLEGPCIFVGNHMSTLETAVLPIIIDPLKPVTFIVKESLVNYPVFKHVMRATDPITVTRTNPRDDFKKVMQEGSERVKSGISIVVFPQTTRSVIFNPDQFNSIGVKLAKNLGVPIIPFALKTDAWQNSKIIKDFGKIDTNKRVYFAFGKPLYIKERGNEEHKAIIDFIQDKLKLWQ